MFEDLLEDVSEDLLKDMFDEMLEDMEIVNLSLDTCKQMIEAKRCFRCSK